MEEQWDVQSRHFFHFGEDLVVDPVDSSSTADAVAGFSLLMMLLRYDLGVASGGGLCFHPRRLN